MNNYYDNNDKQEKEDSLTAAEAEAGEKAIGCLILFIGCAALIVWGVYRIFFY